MSLPREMKALKVDATTKKPVVQTVPVPTLRPSYVLVKVRAVALNPTDWKHLAYFPQVSTTVGCDLSGDVVEVGSEVEVTAASSSSSSSPLELKKGDRVAGFVHGVNPSEVEDGAFGEYAVVKAGILARLPEALGYEEASTLGVGVSTVGQGLYQSLGLAWPGSGDPGDHRRGGGGEWLLIYGGSTATGTLAVQFATLSGYKVVSVNGPGNDGLVKSLGAVATFDYRRPGVGEEVRAFTGGELRKAFDCISEGDSPAICAAAIGPAPGGKVSFLLPVGKEKLGRDDVESETTLAYTVTGEGFRWGPQQVPIPGKREDFEHAKKFWALTEKLLAEGKIKTHPIDKRTGGLDKIQEGLKDLQEGKVSGKKIVYTIA